MKSENIITNTVFFLNELEKYSEDYLKLLNHKEIETTISKFRQLLGIENLSVVQLISEINKVIFEVPILRNEFLGPTSIHEIEKIRFNPNLTSTQDHEAQPKSPIPPVVITNSVKNVLHEMEEAYRKIKKNAS